MRMIKVLLIFLTLAFAMAPEMKLKRVHGNIYMVRGVDALPSVENRGFMSNAFAVLTKEGWVVIDALSTPELSKEFVENLMRVKKGTYKVSHYYTLPSGPLVWCKDLQRAWRKDNSSQKTFGVLPVWRGPYGS